MKKKDIGIKISYMNAAFGKGAIKQVVVYDFDERYPSFATVVDYPINQTLNKHMVWFSDKQGKSSIDNIKQSGDWYVNGIISEIEKIRLNRLLRRR